MTKFRKVTVIIFIILFVISSMIIGFSFLFVKKYDTSKVLVKTTDSGILIDDKNYFCRYFLSNEWVPIKIEDKKKNWDLNFTSKNGNSLFRIGKIIEIKKGTLPYNVTKYIVEKAGFQKESEIEKISKSVIYLEPVDKKRMNVDFGLYVTFTYDSQSAKNQGKIFRNSESLLAVKKNDIDYYFNYVSEISQQSDNTQFIKDFIKSLVFYNNE